MANNNVAILSVMAKFDENSVKQVAQKFNKSMDQVQDGFKGLDFAPELVESFDSAMKKIESKFKNVNLSKYTSGILKDLIDDTKGLEEKSASLQNFIGKIEALNKASYGKKSGVFDTFNTKQLDELFKYYDEIEKKQESLNKKQLEYENTAKRAVENARSSNGLKKAYNVEQTNYKERINEIKQTLGMTGQLNAAENKILEKYSKLLSIFDLMEKSKPEEGTIEAIKYSQELLNIVKEIQATEKLIGNSNYTQSLASKESTSYYSDIAKTSEYTVMQAINAFKNAQSSAILDAISEIETNIANYIKNTIKSNASSIVQTAEEVVDQIDQKLEENKKNQGKKTGGNFANNGYSGEETGSSSAVSQLGRNIDNASDSAKELNSELDTIAENTQNNNIDLYAESAKRLSDEFKDVIKYAVDAETAFGRINEIWKKYDKGFPTTEQEQKDMWMYMQRLDELSLNGLAGDYTLDEDQLDEFNEWAEEYEKQFGRISAMTEAQIKEIEKLKSTYQVINNEIESAPDVSTETVKQTNTLQSYINELQNEESQLKKNNEAMKEHIALFDKNGKLLLSQVGDDRDSQIEPKSDATTVVHSHPYNDNYDLLRFDDKDINTFLSNAVGTKLRQSIVYCGDELLTLNIDGLNDSQIQNLNDQLNRAILAVMMKLGNIDEEQLKSGNVTVKEKDLTKFDANFQNEYSRLVNGIIAQLVEDAGGVVKRQRINPDKTVSDVGFNISELEKAQLSSIVLNMPGAPEYLPTLLNTYERFGKQIQSLKLKTEQFGIEASEKELISFIDSLEKANFPMEEFEEKLSKLDLSSDNFDLYDIRNQLLGLVKVTDQVREFQDGSSDNTTHKKNRDVYSEIEQFEELRKKIVDVETAIDNKIKKIGEEKSSVESAIPEEITKFNELKQKVDELASAFDLIKLDGSKINVEDINSKLNEINNQINDNNNHDDTISSATTPPLQQVEDKTEKVDENVNKLIDDLKKLFDVIKSSDVEWNILFGSNGEISPITSNKRMYVDANEIYSNLLENIANNIYATFHNHPDDAIWSGLDLNTFKGLGTGILENGIGLDGLIAGNKVHFIDFNGVDKQIATEFIEEYQKATQQIQEEISKNESISFEEGSRLGEIKAREAFNNLANKYNIPIKSFEQDDLEGIAKYMLEVNNNSQNALVPVQKLINLIEHVYEISLNLNKLDIDNILSNFENGSISAIDAFNQISNLIGSVDEIKSYQQQLDYLNEAIERQNNLKNNTSSEKESKKIDNVINRLVAQRDVLLEIIEIQNKFNNSSAQPNKTNISSPTQEFDNEIQQNLVMLENYKNTINEIDKLKLEPETDEIKAKIEELNKLADYFASKISVIKSECRSYISPQMMRFNGQWNDNLQNHYNDEQISDFYRIAKERNGVEMSSIKTEFSGISDEINRIENQSEELRQSLNKNLSESRDYVKHLRTQFLSLISSILDLKSETNDEWIKTYQKDIDYAINKYPELEQFKDKKFTSYGSAKDFVDSDEWNDFLATLPQAHKYLESIGYDFEKMHQSAKDASDTMNSTVQMEDSLSERDSYSAHINEEQHAMSTAAESEKSDLSSIQGKVEALETAFRNKTNAITEEKIAMQVAAQGETAAIDSIINKVGELISKLKEVENAPISIDIKLPDTLDSNTSQVISNIKESLSGFSTDELNALSSIIPNLKISKSNVDNLQSLANVILTLKSNLNNLNEGGSNFLSSINELLSKSKDLENLADILKSSKEKITEVSKSVGVNNSDEVNYINILASAYADAEENVKRENEYLKERNRLIEEGKKQEKEYYDNLAKYRSSIVKTNDSQSKKVNTLLSINNTKGGVSDEYIEELNKIEQKYKEIQAYGDLSKLVEEKDIKNVSRLQNELDALLVGIKNVNKGSKDLSVSKTINNISKYMAENTKMSKQFKNQLKELINTLRILGNNADVSSLTDEFIRLQTEIREAGQEGKSFASKIKQQFTHGVAQAFAMYFSLYDVIRYIREGINTLKEFDTALTEMKKVSDETTESLKAYQKTTFDIANTTGTTAKALQESTADYMRLGKSLQDASKLAKDTSILMNVSEFEDINDATESLISMTQAYQELDDMQIIDKLNLAGNNFSISTSDLAQSLQKSAASLKVAGNDFNEAIALTVAGNSILQDPDSVAAGIRTISLRITGTKEAKAELEELGEDVDDFVVGTSSKLDEKVRNFTAVASNNFKGVSLLDDNGNYRSTYEILQDIADVWKEIDELDKQTGDNRKNGLLELLAGEMFCLKIWKHILRTHLIARIA